MNESVNVFQNEVVSGEETYERVLDEAVQIWFPKVTGKKVNRQSDIFESLKRVMDAIFKSRDAKDRVVGLVQKTELTLNLSALLNRLEDKNLAPEDQARINNLLAQVFLIGKESLNWRSSTPPNVTHTIPRVTPVVKEQKVFNLHHIKHFHGLLSRYLPSIDQMSPPHQAWLLILSAIFHSKILTRKGVDGFVKATFHNKPKLITLLNNPTQVELGEAGYAVLSSHTLTAYSQLVRTNQKEFMGYKDLRVNDLRSLFKIYDSDMFRSIPIQLNQIFDIAITDASLSTPSFLLSHTINKIESKPLFFETQYRIFSQKRVGRKEEVELEDIKADFSKINASKVQNTVAHVFELTKVRDLRFQHTFLKTLLNGVVKKTKKAGATELNNVIANPPAGLSLMSWWLLRWLKSLNDRHPQTTGEKILSWGSIKRYFRPIFTAMLKHFDNMDIEILEEEDWLELLQNVLDTSKDKQIGKLIVFFIRFCQKEHGLMPLPLYELSGLNYNSQVNANVVTPYESIKIFERLVVDPQNPTASERAEFSLFILGQFCGLRRREALMLKTANIYGTDGYWYLTVRPFSARSLKSTDSRRKLALSQLVPAFYLKWLIDWFKYQRMQKSFYLFGSNSHLGQLEPNENALLEKVIWAVRDVTGDNTLVFHNLRHGFASFTFLKMMLPSQPTLIPWFGFPQKVPRKFSSANIPLFHELKSFYSPESGRQLLHHNAPKEHPKLPRSTLFILSDLLGHKTPLTSFKSYIHFIDIVSGCYLKTDKTLLTNQMLAYCSDNMTPLALTRLLKRILDGSDAQILEKVHQYLQEQDALKTKIKKIEFCPKPPMVGRKPSVSKHKPKKNHLVDTSLLLTMPSLLLMLEQGRSHDEIVDTLKIPSDAVKRILDNHQHITALMTSKKQPRFNPFPKLMRGHDHQRRMTNLVKTIQGKKIPKRAIEPAIELFLKGADKKNGYQVRLKSEAELKHYLKLYSLIGVPASSLTLIVYPSKQNLCNDVFKKRLKIWLQVFQDEINFKPSQKSLIMRQPIDIAEPLYAELVSMFYKQGQSHRRYEVSLLIFYLALLC